LDANGQVGEKYQYAPFGATTVKNGAGVTQSGTQIGNPYAFTGRRLDYTTGLYYYRARTYSPDLGRFLQRDPLGYVDGMNLYGYVLNNPATWVDPFGLVVVIGQPWFLLASKPPFFRAPIGRFRPAPKDVYIPRNLPKPSSGKCPTPAGEPKPVPTVPEGINPFWQLLKLINAMDGPYVVPVGSQPVSRPSWLPPDAS
jgi:RHS repeat-associated protein